MMLCVAWSLNINSFYEFPLLFQKTTRSEDEHNRRQQRPTNSNETMMQQNPREHQSSARAENDPSLPPYRPRYPSPPRGRHNRPPHRNAVVQSYDNPAFTTDTDETQSTCHEAPINSISMSVDESHVHGDMNNNQDHEMEMVHLWVESIIFCLWIFICV